MPGMNTSLSNGFRRSGLDKRPGGMGWFTAPQRWVGVCSLLLAALQLGPISASASASAAATTSASPSLFPSSSSSSSASVSALDSIEARLRGRPTVAVDALAALAQTQRKTQPPASLAWQETQVVRGNLLVRLADAAGVEAVARELAAIAAPGSPGANPAQAAAELLRAQWLGRHGSLGDADRKLADAMTLLAPTAPAGLRLRFLAAHARIKEDRGQLDAAVALYQQAVLLADQVGPAWRRAEHRNSLAYTLVLAQQLPAAGKVAAEALALAHEAADPLAMAKVLTTLGILQGKAGDAAAELRSMEGAISHAREAGAALEEVLGLANLADYYLKHGDYATAQRLSQQALPLARAARDPVTESVALTNSGLALIGMGQRDAGLQMVRESLVIEERAGGLTAMAQIQREAGLYLERAGFLADAWEAFTEHRRLADEVFRREHQQALLETQAAFEHERQRRELALLATEQSLGEAQLHRRTLTQRLWAVGATAGLLLLAVLSLLLLRLRRSNARLHDSNAQLLEASERDPLTGLANRRHLQRVMRHQQSEVRALQGAVLLIDIDHFKQINDSHGHATGDAVLVEVAERLRTVLRDEDLTVRWGGEEFVVVARNLPAEQVEALVDRLLHAVGGTPVQIDRRQIPVTVSIGFASFPLPPHAPPLPWERAVDLVDSAMYLAKSHGRNRAWGVRSLHDDPSKATLEAAWRAGRADLSQHPGPPLRTGSAPTPSATPATLAGALLMLALAFAPDPGLADPMPASGELAALQARAASQVEIGFDRPDDALATLGDWQAGQARGSPRWQVLQTARGLVAAGAGRHAVAGALAEPLLAEGQEPLAMADGRLIVATSLDVAGQSQQSLAQTEDALARYAAACPTVQPADRCDYRHVWRSRQMLARLLLARGQSSLARDHAQAAAQLAGQHGDNLRQAQALVGAARSSDLLGERDRADRLFAQAQRMARLDASPALMARIALAETLHRDARGDTQGSQRAAERGLPWAQRAGSPRLEALLLTNLSDFYLQAGEPRRALQAVERALPVIRAHGDRRVDRVLLVNASLARIGLGELAAARQTLEQLQAVFRDTGASADQAQLLREFSAALANAGDLRGALDLYHREREVAARLMQANRDTALAELQQRFDREAQQRRLDQLTRDNSLIAAQLDNRSAQQTLWAAAAAALVLAALLAALIYRRVHHVHRRLARNHDVLREQSQRDALTGLANRRALAEAVPGDCSGGLLLIDIDHFKRINDEQGHGAGDLVLVEVARRLQACVRGGDPGDNPPGPDLVVRWGGEEFLIHAPGLDAAATAALASRVLQVVAATPVALAAGEWRVTVSVGHGSFPMAAAPGPMPLDRAVNLVDMALYSAKNQGRNCCVGVAQALAADATTPQPGATATVPG